MNLFHSARLKLTVFYFAVLVVFCLLLTFGARMFTEHEFKRADDARRGAVHSLVQRYAGYDDNNTDTNAPPPPAGDRIFANAQQRQADVTRNRLNRDFILIDIALLAVGAVLSYWYAGRTLRPIEQAHEDQKRFTSDASHELRTPLASMRLENEVFLRQKSFKEPDARELIASNLEEVARLERLATSLLALNSYEHNSLAKQQVSMKDVASDAVKELRSRPGVEAVFSIKMAAGKQSVDRDSMVELLVILLDNAVKYGPAKGPVEVRGAKDGSGYVLTVRDHGDGIADEDLPHIFERMYRADKARSSKIAGHGIGLSLAKQIADANEAELTAANHEQGGAVFRLKLG